MDNKKTNSELFKEREECWNKYAMYSTYRSALSKALDSLLQLMQNDKEHWEKLYLVYKMLYNRYDYCHKVAMEYLDKESELMKEMVF